MIPNSRPQMTRSALLALIPATIMHRLEHDSMFIVGIRGYYKDTMGLPGVNDRGIYDDAIFIVTPDSFIAYNANCDPSRVRKGSGTGAGKGMASLSPGLWRAHRFGKHKGQYEALIQTGGPVTVMRDGLNDIAGSQYLDTGYFGINIHRGGFNTTSSEGCQTIHPNQWPAFIATVTDQAKRIHGSKWRTTTVPYVLIDGTN